MSHTTKDESARKIAADALLHEHDFVESLIPLYRQFQMQLVRFGFLIYAALTALIAARVGGQLDPKILHAVAALTSYPIAFLLLAFATTEVRIMRASRHVSKKIAPALKCLCDGVDVLTWEAAPGGSLNSLERFFSTSISLIVVLSAPALTASLWYIFGGKPEFQVIDVDVAILGLVTLLFLAGGAARASFGHEYRKEQGSDD